MLARNPLFHNTQGGGGMGMDIIDDIKLRGKLVARRAREEAAKKSTAVTTKELREVTDRLIKRTLYDESKGGDQ
jgi:hypothetical protein